jgi:hypothetical protein
MRLWITTSIIVCLSYVVLAFQIITRPNVYFGLKTTEKTPLLMGFGWGNAETSIDTLRHTANDRDNLQRWGWKLHNGVDFSNKDATYGYQIIEDAANNLNISVEYQSSQVEENKCFMFSSNIIGKALNTNANSPLLSLLSYVVDEGVVDDDFDMMDLFSSLRIISNSTIGPTTQVVLLGLHDGIDYIVQITLKTKSKTDSSLKFRSNFGCANCAECSTYSAHQNYFNIGVFAEPSMVWDVNSVYTSSLQQANRKIQEERGKEYKAYNPYISAQCIKQLAIKNVLRRQLSPHRPK